MLNTDSVQENDRIRPATVLEQQVAEAIYSQFLSCNGEPPVNHFNAIGPNLQQQFLASARAALSAIEPEWWSYYADPENGEAQIDDLMETSDDLDIVRVEGHAPVRQVWAVLLNGTVHQFSTLAEAEAFVTRTRAGGV